jgi:acetyltransferase
MRAGIPAETKSASDPGISPGHAPQNAIADGSATNVANWTLNDGSAVALRFICPADEPLMVKFHQTLSQDSVYFRYFGSLTLSQRITHQRLMRVCSNDSDHSLALVAVRRGGQTKEDEILGVGRLIKCDGANEAEFAVVVADAHQGSGLGTYLLRQLIRMARNQGQIRVIGYVLPDNRPMLHICDKLGFRRVQPVGDSIVTMELALRPGGASKAA